MKPKIVCTGFENRGLCAMCGGELPKRRRAYCSDGCADVYVSLFSWGSAYLDASKRVHHKCQACGVTRDGLFKVGLKELGYDDPSIYILYRFEVHHIIPLNGEDRTWHPLNIPSNLRVLCHDCHVYEHSKEYTSGCKQAMMEF